MSAPCPGRRDISRTRRNVRRDTQKKKLRIQAWLPTKAQRIWTPRPSSNPPKYHTHMSRAYDIHADTESVCIRTQTWGSNEGDT